MRTFEAILILVNGLSLIPGSRKQARTAWLGIAGMNIFVFLIHGIFEGLRYQMFFSYIFVLLFIGVTLVKHGKFPAKIPRALQVSAILLSLVLLASTALAAYAFPVFILPEPTGSNHIGIQYFHLIDENRTDPFLDGSTQKRELMVKVYYPAQKDATKPLSRYFGDSPELITVFTAFYNMPDFLFGHLRLVKTNSKEHLQVSNQQPSYPVVLFSHGAGTSMEVQTSQGEDLASHGYIVVAIDHTYVSAATAFPERVVSAKEATTDFNTAEPAEIITQVMAEDVKFVIDELGGMNAGNPDSMFQGKLDLDRIGVIGHSVGGAVAYNLALNDRQVKAAINLDGRVFVSPGENPQNIAPFLMLASDTFHAQTIRDRKSLLKTFEELTEEEQAMMLSMYGSREAYQEAYQKDSQNVLGLTEVLETSGNLFTIAGCDHMKFTDIGMFIGLPQVRELIGIRGGTDPDECLEITNAATQAFFDRYLKNANNTLESVLKTHPKLKKVDLH